MSNKTTKREYHKITPSQIAKYKALEALVGNGTEAIRRLNPTLLSPKDRAYRIAKKSEEQNTVDFIDDSLQLIGVDAINRIGMMVNSTDERVATKNAHYIVDHLRGQAVRRTEAKHLNLTIEAILD